MLSLESSFCSSILLESIILELEPLFILSFSDVVFFLLLGDENSVTSLCFRLMLFNEEDEDVCARFLCRGQLRLESLSQTTFKGST